MAGWHVAALVDLIQQIRAPDSCTTSGPASKPSSTLSGRRSKSPLPLKFGV
jgi:hypothetical protein